VFLLATLKELELATLDAQLPVVYSVKLCRVRVRLEESANERDLADFKGGRGV
jgi:hypothetical protein